MSIVLLVKLKSSLWTFHGRDHDFGRLLRIFVSQYVPIVVRTSRSFPHSWLITGFMTRVTRQVSLVEQELLSLPKYLSSPPVFSGVRVAWSLSVLCSVLYIVVCPVSFRHCVFCPSSIYGFWLPLWYIQTTLFNLHQVRSESIDWKVR